MIPHRPEHIHYITQEKDVGAAINHLLRFDKLGFDTETYHSLDHRKDAFDPVEGARIRLSQWATPEGRSFVFDHFHVSGSYLYMMFPNSFICVGQNLKFDFKFLMYELGIFDYGEIWDTMLAGQLINKGQVAGQDTIPVSLAHLADRELNVVLPKEEQASEWWQYELREEQIQYAARDAQIALAIYEKQLIKIRNQGQVMAAQTDFDDTFPVAEMELNGMFLNEEKWLARCEKVEHKLHTVQQTLWNEFGDRKALFDGIETINLNSQDQMIAAFQKKHIPIPLTRDGKQSLNGKLLANYYTDHPILKTYKEYKELSKSLSSYGPNWVDRFIGLDGRIHGSTKIIGAETGRRSGLVPNLLQVPKDDETRNCFEARPGWIILGMDYSQMELRILAEYCLDPNLLHAFDMGYDLHRYSAHLIFQVPMDKVSGKQRGIAKNLNFGIVYGIGVQKFATDAGIPQEEARKIMDFYLKQAYRGMGSWLDARAREVLFDLECMQARTMSGRIRQYYGDLNLDGVAAQIQRNAKNFPIQGTSADITKRAAYLLYQKLRMYRPNIKLINMIHDEIILEVRAEYVEVARRVLYDCMIQAEQEYLKRVKSVVDESVTLCWAKEASPEQKAEANELLKGVRQVEYA